MKDTAYEIVRVGISKTSEAIKGKNIFYKCNRCQTVLPSWPKDNARCLCWNISIDKDLNRLTVEDYSNFVILRKKE